MGKIGINLFLVMGTPSKPKWVYGAKNKFCLNDLKFGTLVFWVIRNDF